MEIYPAKQVFLAGGAGEDRGNNAYSTTMKVYAPLTEQYLNTFNQVWNDNDRLADVTDTVLENITAAYKENSPEFIYFVALYNIFSEFLNPQFIHLRTLFPVNAPHGIPFSIRPYIPDLRTAVT